MLISTYTEARDQKKRNVDFFHYSASIHKYTNRSDVKDEGKQRVFGLIDLQL